METGNNVTTQVSSNVRGLENSIKQGKGQRMAEEWGGDILNWNQGKSLLDDGI